MPALAATRCTGEPAAAGFDRSLALCGVFLSGASLAGAGAASPSARGAFVRGASSISGTLIPIELSTGAGGCAAISRVEVTL